MRYSDIKEGQLVADSWWPCHVGTIVQKLKTRVKIKFFDDNGVSRLESYDHSHLQFLTEV